LSLWFTQASTKYADESKLVSYARMKCSEVSRGETGDQDKYVVVKDQCLFICRCFNRPQRCVDNKRSEHHFLDKNNGKIFGMRSTAAPDGLVRKNSKIWTQLNKVYKMKNLLAPIFTDIY
jgi:hypothetical protein